MSIHERSREKRGWSALVWFVNGGLIGSVLTGVLVYSACVLASRANLVSDLGYPTHSMLMDIDETLQAGNCDLASKKISLMQSRWKDWMDGGASPESFAGEIKNLKK